MQRLIVKLTPGSTRALIVTFITIEAVVLVTALVTVLVLFSDPLDELHLTALTALVISAPVVWTLLISLRHQKQLQDRLLRLATTDMLTGLPNRRAFLDQVAPGGTFANAGALVLADADHFKRINDSLGHDIGDVCLQALAVQLTDLLSQGDIAARYGGEEFALFCLGASEGSLRGLEARLCRPVVVAREEGGPLVSVTLSAGAVLAGQGVSSIEAYRAADRALYEAKATGRAKLVITGTPLCLPDAR